MSHHDSLRTLSVGNKIVSPCNLAKACTSEFFKVHLYIYPNFFIETCLDPSINTNSRVIGNQFDNGKEVEFVCPRNELLIPEISRKLTCENGKWNGIIPSCKGTV